MTDPTKNTPAGANARGAISAPPLAGAARAAGAAGPRYADGPELDDASLDLAFDALRAEAEPAAPLSAGFQARLLAEAEASMPRARTRSVRDALAGLRSALAQWGPGWPAGIGLAACALAGLWFGYAPPPVLEGAADALLAETGLLEDPDAGAEALLMAFDFGGFDG